MTYIITLALAIALIAVAVGTAARRWFGLPLIWAIAVGALVFVGLSLTPIPTHAVVVELPKN